MWHLREKETAPGRELCVKLLEALWLLMKETTVQVACENIVCMEADNVNYTLIIMSFQCTDHCNMWMISVGPL